jgi:indolepyruvate decarboxylase
VLAFPNDLVHKPIASAEIPDDVPLRRPASDPVALEQAVSHIVRMMSEAKTACIFPGIAVRRAGLSEQVTALIDATGLPFTTGIQDKTTLNEAHPNYMGLWIGEFTNPEVHAYVKSCDCILGFGPERHYFNMGFFSMDFETGKTINVHLHSARVGDSTYDNVEMKDVLGALVHRLPKWDQLDAPSKITPYVEATGSGSDPIDAGNPFYARLASFLKPGDILVGDPGSPGLVGAFVQMPDGATWEGQSLAASIGFGTPAALGVAVAAPECRGSLLVPILETAAALLPEHHKVDFLPDEPVDDNQG